MDDRNTPITQTATQLLTGGTPLSDTYELTMDGWLEWAGLKATENITETVTVTIDSLDGAAWDIEVKTTNLSASRNFFYQPSRPIRLRKGDKVKITCTAGNNTGTANSTLRIAQRETVAP